MARSHHSLPVLALAIALPVLAAGSGAAQTDTTGNDAVPRTRSDPGGTSTFGSPMGGPGAGPGSTGVGSGTGRSGASGDVAPPAGRSGSTTTPALGGTGASGPIVTERPSPTPRAAMPDRSGADARSGSTTAGPVGTGGTGTARSGGGRLDDEAARTALLNRFGGLGFAALDEFRRTGTGYEADVRTVTGERMTVDIDPRTGAVSTRR